MNEWTKMWHIDTRENNSVIKRREVLSFATIWLDLKGIMLSEISQTKTNTTQYHLYMKSKNSQTHKKCGNGGQGK